MKRIMMTVLKIVLFSLILIVLAAAAFLVLAGKREAGGELENNSLYQDVKTNITNY